MEWLRQNINNGTENGEQQWTQLTLWVNTPPAPTLRAVEATRAVSPASAARARAEAAVGREDTAFAAFAGKAGR